MKKILVPVDFSDISKQASYFAKDLAERSNAEIIFLHSMNIQYFGEFPYHSGINFQKIINDMQNIMEEKTKNFIQELDIKVKTHYIISLLHLVEAVKDLIKSENIGLVILGTQGSSGWSELFIGSNTERIVRWADSPVISIPKKTSFDSIRKILVPIDLREIQDDFMKKLLNIQELFKSEINFLWVKTPHNIENSESVQKEFKELIKSFGFKNTSLVITKRVFPTDGILEYATELKVDMIAMATHARRGISHWLHGSIAEDTINHASLPIWTFKLDKDAENHDLKSLHTNLKTPEYKKIKNISL